MESSCFIEYKIDPRIEIITVFFSNPKLKHVHPIKSYKNNFSQFKLEEIDKKLISKRNLNITFPRKWNPLLLLNLPKTKFLKR